MINCLILEDEYPAVEVLQGFIMKTPFLAHIGSYESGLDMPIEKIKTADLLFLDIQLPELNGLSFLKTLTNPPKVIVTTAYPDFALEAFEEAVTDYLLKPYSYERFYKSANRIRELLKVSKTVKSIKLTLYADKTIHKINSNEILYLKSEVDYVKVVTADKHVLILDSLQHWEEKLRDLLFIRPHRSYVVNMNRINHVTGNQISIEGSTIPIGRTYKNNFIERFYELQ